MKSLASFGWMNKSVITGISLTSFLVSVSPALAAQKEWKSSGCILTIGGVDIPTLKCFEVVFQNILTIAVSLAALALFVMLVVGGFKFLTSAGDPKQAGSAKATMTYAVIGIALMALTFLIFRLIETFTGVKNLLRFEIPNQP